MSDKLIVKTLRALYFLVGAALAASCFGLAFLGRPGFLAVLLVGMFLWALSLYNLERSSLFLNFKTDQVISDFRERRIDYATAWERLLDLQKRCGHRSLLRLELQCKADEARRLFIERQPKHPRAVRNDPYY